jgi:hypothetical protein
MTDEIKALREEVAKLRERIAVLEARPAVPMHTMVIGTGQPLTVGSPQYQLPTITCRTAG